MRSQTPTLQLPYREMVYPIFYSCLASAVVEVSSYLTAELSDGISLAAFVVLLVASPSSYAFLIVPTVTYLLMNMYSQSYSNGPRLDISPVKSLSSKDIFARTLLASFPANSVYGPPGP